MPWLKTDPGHIILWVPDTNEIKLLQFFKYLSGGKPVGKIHRPVSLLANVKVGYTVERVSWWGQGSRGQGKIPLVFVCLVQKKHELLNDTADTGGEVHFAAHMFFDLFIQCPGFTLVQIIA